VCSTANDKTALLRNGTKGLYQNPPAATLNVFLEWSESPDRHPSRMLRIFR
jgi:hypothetical protein